MSSATETKTWSNAGSKAMVSWSAQFSSGSGSITVKDAAGTTVFTKSFSGMSQQADSGLTTSGKPGDWTIVVKFTAATGQMALNMSPA